MTHSLRPHLARIVQPTDQVQLFALLSSSTDDEMKTRSEQRRAVRNLPPFGLNLSLISECQLECLLDNVRNLMQETRGSKK